MLKEEVCNKVASSYILGFDDLSFLPPRDPYCMLGVTYGGMSPHPPYRTNPPTHSSHASQVADTNYHTQRGAPGLPLDANQAPQGIQCLDCATHTQTSR